MHLYHPTQVLCEQLHGSSYVSATTMPSMLNKVPLPKHFSDPILEPYGVATCWLFWKGELLRLRGAIFKVFT